MTDADSPLAITANRALDTRMVSEIRGKLESIEARRPAIITLTDVLGAEIGDDFMDLVNNIKNRPGHVVTRVRGRCCSGAIMLFLSGHERVMAPDAILEDHDVIVSVSLSLVTEDGRLPDDLLARARKAREFCFAMYQSRTNIPERLIEKLFGADVRFSPQQAINSGIAHRIG
jgi:ATP-dependent protease ClpP protease subunit